MLAIRVLFELAGAHHGSVDVHLDETLDADCCWLEVLADAVEALGFHGRVTVSHCCSLGVQPAAVQACVAERLARARVSMVTLSQTSLWLHRWEVATAVPSGLTAVAALRRAGVTLAGGGDNVRDLLEAAGLLVAAGHVDPAVAFDAVTGAARTALGREATSAATVAEGDVADSWRCRRPALLRRWPPRPPTG